MGKLGNYLYHYTNIDSLALILKNQTIRFNPLNKMDDMLDGQSNDVINAKKLCYISSWTSNKEEDIGLWKTYTSLNCGVRIGLCKSPFRTYTYNNCDLKNYDESKIAYLKRMLQISNSENLRLYVPFNKLFSENYFIANYNGGPEVIKVEYTNDESKLKPTLIDKNNGEYTIHFPKIGVYKQLYWKQQNEYRYRVFIYPLMYYLNDKEIQKEIQNFTQKIINDEIESPVKYYDFEIDENAFKNMEILLSPTISLGYKEIVRCIVDTYNPTAKIEQSCLNGQIRG